VSASFEGTSILPAPTANPDNTGNTIALQIPSSVTAKPGYKEILAVVKPSAPQPNGTPGAGSTKATAKTIALPILVIQK
jgi:hypothetical protein